MLAIPEPTEKQRRSWDREYFLQWMLNTTGAMWSDERKRLKGTPWWRLVRRWQLWRSTRFYLRVFEVAIEVYRMAETERRMDLPNADISTFTV